MKNNPKAKELLKTAIAFVFLILMTLVAGCADSSQRVEIDGSAMTNAKLRWGAFFGSPFGMKFTNPDKLGPHRPGFGTHEVNGMLYTCKGGFIDVGDVREAADRTAFVKEVVYKNLVEGQTDFSFQVIEPSNYNVTIAYPDNWNRYSQSEQQAIAKEVSIAIGQYVAHSSLIWHEIITWFGFATVPGFSDKISSFSPEDCYSDVLGTILAAKALTQTRLKYNDAMTQLFDEEIKQLEVQPPAVARKAAKAVKGDWYTGGFYYFVKMKVRNFDVGYDNGMVSPVRVPGICDQDSPKAYPAPRLDLLNNYGFGFSVTLDPRISQKNKIYEIISLEKNKLIDPAIHFAAIIDKLKNDSNMAYGNR